MTFRASLKNLIRRAPDASLRQRATELKVGLTQRAEPEAGQTRRAIVAGSLAAAVPLPALAAIAVASPDQPHPDQALFDAEAEMLHAEQAYDVARKAWSTAHRAAVDEIGICPAALLIVAGDTAPLSPPFAPKEVWRCRIYQWVKANDEDEHHSGRAWTAEGLRMAIRYAVPVYGRGGTTPARIRRYRELLPLAEAYDARRAEIEARYRTEELHTTYREAGRAMSAARDAMDVLRATTPAGLAVLVRHLGSYENPRVEKGWIGLLQSAASVAGIEVSEPVEPRIRTTFM